MAELLDKQVGILPAGALGVSFFYHLTQQLQNIDGGVFFIERVGSASAQAIRQGGYLRIADAAQIHSTPAPPLFKGDLLTCFQRGVLPEVVLVCPNPDQLLSVLSGMVSLLERIFDQGGGDVDALPIFVLCSNGIYFQRVRLIFIEKIEEAALLGRLPDLWPDIMPHVVGRLLRGVTMQTGVREGFGAETIYRPGPHGVTRISGGEAASRERCCRILQAKGGWFEEAVQGSATRLEFDKGMVNLATNLMGQLYAIDDQGRFTPLTIRDILKGHEAEIRELCLQVFIVGQAVRVYEQNDDFEEIFAKVMEILHLHETHIPSSLQWVALKYGQRALEPKLTPTEAWLLTPLIRYARSAGLDATTGYFEDLKKSLLHKLILAAKSSAIG